MSNLRDASRSFADRKNGADEWIADKAMETTRRRKIPQVLIPRPRDPDRYDFLATCLRGIKIKRHWFGRGGGEKTGREKNIKPVFL